MKTYPLMTFSRFLFWIMFAKIKKIRPYWYIDYNKEEAREFLGKEYGWHYYGGHHLENRMTSFFHMVYLPQKFNTDMRNNTLSALVREGKMDRDEAIRIYKTPPKDDKDIVEYFKKRLELSDKEYENIMNRSPRSWKDYPTYKKDLKNLDHFFIC